jgi:hypothetical protein
MRFRCTYQSDCDNERTRKSGDAEIHCLPSVGSRVLLGDSRGTTSVAHLPFDNHERAHFPGCCSILACNPRSSPVPPASIRRCASANPWDCSPAPSQANDARCNPVVRASSCRGRSPHIKALTPLEASQGKTQKVRPCCHSHVLLASNREGHRRCFHLHVCLKPPQQVPVAIVHSLESAVRFPVENYAAGRR